MLSERFEAFSKELECHIESGRLMVAMMNDNGTDLDRDDPFPEVSPQEIQAIMVEFEFPGSASQFGFGLYLGDTKYVLNEGVPNAVIRGTKADGGGGVIIKKLMGTGFVIGIHDENFSAEQASLCVEEMGYHVMIRDQ